ncbi:MAG: hypothetical protein A4E28_03184 [Methanocella sp. PtaU1.Bin125]|nr:MAG: hypothetical protein A4E28_03184 [Methanocella sp. PtaU1.Bin125]
MRLRSISVFTFALVIALSTQPAAAQPFISIPFVSAGQFAFIQPSAFASVIILEANMSHMASENAAAFAVSLMPAHGDAPPGQAVAPSIAQTCSHSLICDQAYFFQDFLSS